MEKIETLLIVNADSTCNGENEKKLRESGLINHVKVTLNGGHALLFLNQISHKTVYSKTVVLLNMNTPIADGFDFLEGYKYSHEINKENVLIIVFDDNLDEDKLERTQKLGIKYFTSSSLCVETLKHLIRDHFADQDSDLLNETISDEIADNHNMAQAPAMVEAMIHARDHRKDKRKRPAGNISALNR